MVRTHKPVLCVGALTHDTIFQMAELPPGPGKFLPLAATDHAAGMSSSAATAIARLGGPVALWASVGSDPTGQRLVDEIAAEGVDCTNVRVVNGARTAFSTILVDQRGERIIVPRYDEALLSPPSELPDMSHYSAVLVDVRWQNAAISALTEARKAGIPAILDADVAPLETLDRLLPLATHIVASEPAAYSITGQDNPRDAVSALSRRHPDAFVSVTAGADGVYWIEAGGQALMHGTAPRIVARDTLAAGDVFHGAFTLGLVEGMPMSEIMTFAATAAAIKCEVFGGRLGAPTRQQLEARLALAR